MIRARPAPEVLVDVAEEVSTPWRVILFNDDVHAFEEVIIQLVKAIGCTEGRATELAWEAHTKGKSIVFEGDFQECFRVQSVLREIALITEIRG